MSIYRCENCGKTAHPRKLPPHHRMQDCFNYTPTGWLTRVVDKQVEWMCSDTCADQFLCKEFKTLQATCLHNQGTHTGGGDIHICSKCGIGGKLEDPQPGKYVFVPLPKT